MSAQPGTGPDATVRSELFGPSRRATTIGLVLLISLVAFESMGVGTAMPALVADLGAVSSYAWPFVAFMGAAVAGTVLGGRWCDLSGPRVPLIAAPVLFGIGLLVAGTAGTMAQLLAGRVLQGLGAGAQAVAVYVLIAAVYADRARPAVFALISSAWVLPALIGPPVAGLVTERLSWHWVFLGLVPVVLLVPSMRRLLPSGVFRARRGIPAVVAGRGLLAGAFFTVNSYLPLMLAGTHGWSLAAAGLPLIVGSLGWSAASAWQGRHPDLYRPALLRVGFVGVAIGTAGLLLVAPSWGTPWLALPVWGVAGVGMGLGFASVSYLLLQQSGAGEVGFHSSAAQMADQLTTAAMIGAGGALLALLGSPATALPVLLAVLTGLAVLGATIAGRSAARPAA
ncbi:MFS transporter [Pseudonocardia bannensis]|uniref:MFS transporter n=1 Tax=Pseudonocardia bannensis TaxID=630973 RepID=A0A848DQR3_9PSEU|nr:MFS transporter [Pseudonocardia bannensis]NMH95200.1 MFS transporter [Pseudonocardia bannensis]